MSSATTRTGTVPANTAPRSGNSGKAPGGMWWAAWRQQRLAVTISGLVLAAIAAALLVWRSRLAHALQQTGCDLADLTDDCLYSSRADAFWQSGAAIWHTNLHYLLVALPIAIGVFLGAPIFSQELTHGTATFALTQSISRTRWWATKLVVAGVPVTIGLLGIGLLTQWADSTYGVFSDTPLGPTSFETWAIMPAATGLASFAFATTIGIIARGTVASLAIALVVAIGIATLVGSNLRTEIVPVTRLSAPLETSDPSQASSLEAGPGSLYLGSGYLTADGTAIRSRDFKCDPPAELYTTGSQAEIDSAVGAFLTKCNEDAGIVATYTDIIPPTEAWTMRWRVAASETALAALALLLGAAWLRRSVWSRR